MSEAIEKYDSIEISEEEYALLMENLKKESVDDVEDVLFGERVIYLNDEVTTSTIDEIVPLIHYYNIRDNKAKLNPSEREPLKIYINTRGGCLYSGLYISEEIQNSITPIITICNGIAMSAGLLIFLSSKDRRMGETATLLYHEARADNMGGTLVEIERIGYEFHRLQKIVDDIVVRETNVTQEVLDEHKGKINDWHLGKQEALKYGFIRR